MIRCMLTRRSCSGFERDDLWGYRALEPSRCCIASIALVLLKTGISHSASAENHSDAASPSSENGPAFSEDGTGGMQVDAQQLATAQKLLLFWRKPAVRPYTSPLLIPELILLAPPTAKVLVGRDQRGGARRHRQGGDPQGLGAARLDP